MYLESFTFFWHLYEYQIKLTKNLKKEQGAAVIDSKGYLVGIYNGIKNSKESLTAQITPASELKEILKSFNISFATDQTNQIDHNFEETLKRCHHNFHLLLLRIQTSVQSNGRTIVPVRQ